MEKETISVVIHIAKCQYCKTSHKSENADEVATSMLYHEMSCCHNPDNKRCATCKAFRKLKKDSSGKAHCPISGVTIHEALTCAHWVYTEDKPQDETPASMKHQRDIYSIALDLMAEDFSPFYLYIEGDKIARTPNGKQFSLRDYYIDKAEKGISSKAKDE